MPSARVVTFEGAEVGMIELNASVFDAPLHEHLVHEVAVALRNARRQGNAETKTRAYVSGTGKKPYRQKGTGNARHGSMREPQMRGGGTVFGPHKRSYRQNVPMSFRRQALCSLLSDRVRHNALCVLDQLACEKPKTKPFAEMVSKVAPGGKRTLFVMADVEKNALLSARNLQKVLIRTAADLNVLDVLAAGQVVIVQNALPKLEERLTAKSGKERTQ